jgi:hypothetical protein
MAGPSSSGPRAGVLVLAGVGLLLVVGRLWGHGLEQPALPARVSPSVDGQVFAPVRPLPDGLDFAQPINGLAVTSAAVWVAYGTTIARLDPHTLRVTASLQVTAAMTGVPLTAWPVRGLAAGRDAIWVSLSSPSADLLRIDPSTARVTAVVPQPTVAPVAVGSSGVWVVCCGGETYLGGGQLARVDPATNRVTARIALPGFADAVGVGPSGVWVRAAAGPVWRIDPATNRVAATVTVPHGLGGGQGSVLVGRDAVWVSDPSTGTVLRIDPRSNRIAGRTEVAGPALAAAADGTVVATGQARVFGLGRGPVRSVGVDGVDGKYVTALAADADRIWIAESSVLLHVDQRGLR